MSTTKGPSISLEALTILARWFAGPNDKLTSHPPHAALSVHQAAMDELVANGLVIKSDFNRHGVLQFEPTAEAAKLGWDERHRLIKEMFA